MIRITFKVWWKWDNDF